MLRHLLAILLLPTTAVVLVPTVLLRRFGLGAVSIGTVPDLLFQGFGAVTFTAGLGLLFWCIRLFARVGEGTLAPWDPPRHLVIVGPYRHVRNPMISGVSAMLFGLALGLRSSVVLAWMAGFILINHAYFAALEEPGLERRFGAPYRAYRDRVPRWVPRVSPWTGD